MVGLEQTTLDLQSSEIEKSQLSINENQDYKKRIENTSEEEQEEEEEQQQQQQQQQQDQQYQEQQQQDQQNTQQLHNKDIEDIPPKSSDQRKSSLSNGTISIRDFGYDVDHILHHIVLNSENDYKSHLIDDEEEDENDEDYEDYDEYGEDDYYEEGGDEEYETKGNYNTSRRSAKDIMNNSNDHGHQGNLDDVDEEEEEEEEEGAGLQAIALYSFSPENQNELALQPNQIVIINYDYGDGWFVAYDPVSEKTGFVPENYVHIVNDNEELEDILSELQGTQEGYIKNNDEVEEEAEEEEDEEEEEEEGVGQYEGDLVTHEETATARPFLPGIIFSDNLPNKEGEENSDWVDEEEEKITENGEDINDIVEKVQGINMK